MKRTAIAGALTLLFVGLGHDLAAAKVRLAAGGATVTFPIGTPERNNGERHAGRHGDPRLMLFLSTFDRREASQPELDALLFALKSKETWQVWDRETQQAFWFTTMAFPNSLAASLWTGTCEVPSADPREFICRRVTIGGVSGREYLVRTRDPLRPGVRPYLIQQIVVRNDRLYLLAYDGIEDAATLPADRPSTPQQRAFMKSLRIQAP